MLIGGSLTTDAIFVTVLDSSSEVEHIITNCTQITLLLLLPGHTISYKIDADPETWVPNTQIPASGNAQFLPLAHSLGAYGLAVPMQRLPYFAVRDFLVGLHHLPTQCQAFDNFRVLQALKSACVPAGLPCILPGWNNA